MEKRGAPRLLIVGEAPSDRAFERLEARNGERAEAVARRIALTGAVGARLAGLLGEPWPHGLVPWRGVQRYRLRNLQDVPWSRRAYHELTARMAAQSLALETAGEGGLVLALGRRVSRAFGGPFQFLRLEEVGSLVVGLFPHPSRRNRWWDNRAQAEDALVFARSIRVGLEAGVDPRGLGGWSWSESPYRFEGLYHETRARAEAVATLARFWTGRLAPVERLARLDAHGVVISGNIEPTWLSLRSGLMPP